MTEAAAGAPKPAPQPAPQPVEPPVPPLPHAVSGERIEIESSAGRLSFYRAGPPPDLPPRPPMLLVHSINASASAYEVRPLHEHFACHRTVYSIDLPGYGFSERRPAEYTPRQMTDALHALVARIALEQGPGPIDAFALSLSSEFLARAAVEAPTAFRSLALASPTGFSGRTRRYGPPGSTRKVGWLYRFLSRPSVGPTAFRWLTRPGVIRYFLARTWGSPNIDEGLWAYDLITTRQPEARHAPISFLSACLFSADINTLYEALALPVWVSHGVRGDFVDYRGLSTVRARGNWQVSVFQAGALPYFEVGAAFIADYERFLDSIGRP